MATLLSCGTSHSRSTFVYGSLDRDRFAVAVATVAQIRPRVRRNRAIDPSDLSEGAACDARLFVYVDRALDRCKCGGVKLATRFEDAIAQFRIIHRPGQEHSAGHARCKHKLVVGARLGVVIREKWRETVDVILKRLGEGVTDLFRLASHFSRQRRKDAAVGRV